MSQAPQDGARPPCSGNTSNTHITCFSCRVKGHYASDIKCPNYGNTSISQCDKPWLWVAHADDDNKHSTELSNMNGAHEMEGQAKNPLDGSQFDNETECEDIHSDSTSTASTEQEEYQRPMCLNTPFSEIDSDDDYIVYNCAARVTNTPIKEYPSHSSLRKKEDWPSHSSKDTACLSTWVTINGVRALTLFNSESMTDSVSPDFMWVADLRLFQLMKQVALQLGCVGSRGSINYGVCPTISFASIKEQPYYLDVVNIDRYDCILGTPFMQKYNIGLDFGNNAIIVYNRKVLAMLDKEESSLLASCQWFPVKNQQAEPEGSTSPWLHSGPSRDTSSTRVEPSTTIKNQKTRTSNMHDIWLNCIEGQSLNKNHGLQHLMREDDNWKYSDKDIPKLQEQWIQAYLEFFSDRLDVLSPLRQINHHIPLINDKKRYHYCQPQCPDAYKEQLLQNINQYVKANWWIPITTNQAAPMLCIPKKEGILCTIIDQWEWNTNTIKDVTPMPDQDNICNSVACAHY
jgi:hypothetical protein